MSAVAAGALCATQETDVDASRQQHQSHLFTVRLWAEDLGDGRAERRGQAPLEHWAAGLMGLRGRVPEAN